MKAKYLYWAIAAAAIVALLVWLKRRQDRFTLPEADPATGAPAAPGLNLDLVLAKGSRGAEVEALQQRLHRDGYASITGAVDGIFGTKTQAGLQAAKGVARITLRQYDAAPRATQQPGPRSAGWIPGLPLAATN